MYNHKWRMKYSEGVYWDLTPLDTGIFVWVQSMELRTIKSLGDKLPEPYKWGGDY